MGLDPKFEKCQAEREVGLAPKTIKILTMCMEHKIWNMAHKIAQNMHKIPV